MTPTQPFSASEFHREADEERTPYDWGIWFDDDFTCDWVFDNDDLTEVQAEAVAGILNQAFREETKALEKVLSVKGMQPAVAFIADNGHELLAYKGKSIAIRLKMNTAYKGDKRHEQPSEYIFAGNLPSEWHMFEEWVRQSHSWGEPFGTGPHTIRSATRTKSPETLDRLWDFLLTVRELYRRPPFLVIADILEGKPTDLSYFIPKTEQIQTIVNEVKKSRQIRLYDYVK